MSILFNSLMAFGNDSAVIKCRITFRQAKGRLSVRHRRRASTYLNVSVDYTRRSTHLSCSIKLFSRCSLTTFSVRLAVAASRFSSDMSSQRRSWPSFPPDKSRVLPSAGVCKASAQIYINQLINQWANKIPNLGTMRFIRFHTSFVSNRPQLDKSRSVRRY